MVCVRPLDRNDNVEDTSPSLWCQVLYSAEYSTAKMQSTKSSGLGCRADLRQQVSQPVRIARRAAKASLAIKHCKLANGRHEVRMQSRRSCKFQRCLRLRTSKSTLIQQPE